MTTELRGQARMAAYHEANQGPDLRRLEKIARRFQPNPRLERILAMPENKREALLASNSTLRMSLGGYQQMKAAHEQMEARNQ
jgi:ribosomal protein L28